jgi:hypothetical protein
LPKAAHDIMQNHESQQIGGFMTSSKNDLPVLNPEETARRVAAVERYQERRRQLWDSLTPEEKAEHDRQFEELYQLLAESRG